MWMTLNSSNYFRSKSLCLQAISKENKTYTKFRALLRHFSVSEDLYTLELKCSGGWVEEKETLNSFPAFCTDIFSVHF